MPKAVDRSSEGSCGTCGREFRCSQIHCQKEGLAHSSYGSGGGQVSQSFTLNICAYGKRVTKDVFK